MSLDGGGCVWFPGSLLPWESRAVCVAMMKASSILWLYPIPLCQQQWHTREEMATKDEKAWQGQTPRIVRVRFDSQVFYDERRRLSTQNAVSYCSSSGWLLESELSSWPCKTHHFPHELRNWCGEIVQLACFPILLKTFTKGLPQSKQKPFLGKAGNTEKSVLSPGSTALQHQDCFHKFSLTFYCNKCLMNLKITPNF